MEGMWKESSAHTVRIFPRLRYACSRIVNRMIGNTASKKIIFRCVLLFTVVGDFVEENKTLKTMEY
ncbi:hypothetical protein ACS0TY_033321 [Phlomoides rotata]